MLITIAELLSQRDLASAHELCSGLSWRDGSETAGSVAGQVKRNFQADLTSRLGVRLNDLLEKNITAHPILVAAAQPSVFSKILVSKTEVGGGYGLHIDNAFMTKNGKALRTDLSYTLFLSPPESYQGGELVIEQAGQTLSFKPNAGDLVLYPTTSLHRVNEVSAGTRLACVGWIESRVPRPDDRATLFDLINLKAELSATYAPQSAEMLTVAKVIANLKRRFN